MCVLWLIRWGWGRVGSVYMQSVLSHTHGPPNSNTLQQNQQQPQNQQKHKKKVDVIFPGLPRGRHYKFTAQARNALGISQASTSVDVTLE